MTTKVDELGFERTHAPHCALPRLRGRGRHRLFRGGGRLEMGRRFSGRIGRGLVQLPLAETAGGRARRGPQRTPLSGWRYGTFCWAARLCYSTVFSDTGAAVVAGMLVLIAAIFIEILFELVYARKRTLDHQDL
jgi:hypothetical protein